MLRNSSSSHQTASGDALELPRQKETDLLCGGSKKLDWTSQQLHRTKQSIPGVLALSDRVLCFSSDCIVAECRDDQYASPASTATSIARSYESKQRQCQRVY